MSVTPDKVSEMLRFDGKVVLITGAASGIGRAQVELFMAAGARVAAVDVNAAGLESLACASGAAPDKLFTFTVDLGDAEAITECIAQIQPQLGCIDVLCNTAGVLDGFSRCLDTDEALWQQTMNINVSSIFRLTKAVLPQMLERGGGVIINVASIAGLFAGGGGAAYTASKHAVLGFTKQLSFDYGRKGVRANAICPGMIDTGMTQDVLADPDSKFSQVVRSVPAGRVGHPQDIANATLFLASEAAQFIHGASIMVDGGLTIK
ncbi:glucose 1-dehydrogenase [Pseudomonas sp. v388]|uniref:SDR family NAD(P)-dependent oxidoreductase n=1 Tax=Pseudomonas sp. v388 TaxID=2479849 RepID=UPI000F768A9C|nr:glucose 1-dehydrogenase [Pseudomonas sp. v388]RRV10474.1 glucose 1-dehydrogenase [Pseudomonas sp. v388]